MRKRSVPVFPSSWAARAGLIVLLVTALRVLALAFTRADIFVDEAQYWLWGENLDFGYYSKPPLIAWLIRAMTEISGTDSAFWIRLPAPLLHGVTAMVLGLWAHRLFGEQAAFWTAIGYVTLPIVAVGSILISTDTVMAPFLAGALLFYWRLADNDRAGDAVAVGLLLGVAFLAKYAAVYFFLGAALAALMLPGARPSMRNVAALLAAFVLVISPNILWNIANELTTLEHTMDNVSWVRGGGDGAALRPLRLVEFLATQFAVAGPILFTALLLALGSPDPRIGKLMAFVLPVLALVSLQALLSRAYGNWAFAAYLPGVLAATVWLMTRSQAWLRASVVVNAAICLALPLLTIFGTGLTWNGSPILARYLGRDELSRQILAIADEARPAAIVSSNRDVLADLFLTGQRYPVPFRAVPPEGRAGSYYEQLYPLDPDTQGRVLFITSNRKEIRCGGDNLSPLAPLKVEGTAYEGKNLRVYLLQPDCFGAMR